MSQIHKLITNLEGRAKELTDDYPQARILSRGTMLYSDYTDRQIKQDISTLSIVAIFGMNSLILIVFRSMRSLLLCFLSIGIGWCAGGQYCYVIGFW
ncbi:MAG: hypothetical protein AB8W37_07710 [Arsenophonus endosymbiont of Dermacentor nuttalli]